MVLVILREESLNSDSQRTTTLHNKSLNTDKNKIRKQKQNQKTKQTTTYADQINMDSTITGEINAAY